MADERKMATKQRLALLLATIIMLGLVVSYSSGSLAGYLSGGTQNENENSESNFEGNIKISGAWALYPMMVKWAEEYQKIHPGVRIDISAGGAGKGMTDALGGLVDIGMVSREIYPSEIERGAVWVACIKDAVVPTANANNPIVDKLVKTGVTKEIFEDIWVVENATTWGQIVGTDAKDKINVYTRSDSCGASETWAKYLGNYKQEDLNGVGVYGDPGIAEAVRNDPLGIGYNNLNYAYDSNTEKPVDGLVVIPLDVNGNGEVDADEDFYSTKSELVDAIISNAYPSPPARELNLVTKEKFSGATKEFVKWILTDGQQYGLETGYIQLSQERLNDGLAKLG